MLNHSADAKALGLSPLPFTAHHLRLIVALFAECRNAKGTLRDELEELTTLTIVHIEREGDVNAELMQRLRDRAKLPSTLRVLA